MMNIRISLSLSTLCIIIFMSFCFIDKCTATLYTTEDLVGVWRSKSGNKNFDCRSKSEDTLQCNNDDLYEISIVEEDGETILTSWVGSKGTFDGKAAITWKTVKNVKIVWYREGGVKTTVAEDVNELKIEVAKLYKMLRRQIGYCDKYYFGESWRDCKTDEEVTTKDAKCKMPANDATTQSLSSTAQSKEWYCGP